MINKHKNITAFPVFEQQAQSYHVDTLGFSGGWGIIGGNGALSCIGLRMGVCLSRMSVTSSLGVDIWVAIGRRPFCD